MSEPLAVSAAFDHRFGTLQLDVKGIIRLKLVDLIKNLGIPQDEMAALFEERYEWTEGQETIEPARVRAIAETEMGGKVVLDIGGYDGYMAAQALRQGAKRAICLDNQQYEHYGWQEKKLPGVEYITGDFMDWTEPVDVVIFFNVLYHLHHPWRALDHLRQITKEEMLLCSLFRYNAQPVWYLYEPLECNPEDRTVYWGPSILGLERMLKFTGWEIQQEGLAYDRVVYRCRPIPDFEPDLAKEGFARS